MEFSIYYANIKDYDIADGIGVRVSLFVSGCNRHCEGCHNKDAWDFKYGKPFTQETLDSIVEKVNKDNITGFSILGGEPLDPKNVEDVKKIIKYVKTHTNKSIWLWTSYTWEHILDAGILSEEILNMLDVIVDGEFILSKRDITLSWRGSNNQRVIDVKKSLANNKLTILEGLKK